MQSMFQFHPKRPRIRLAQESYQNLRLQVLERDGWRCQSCGSLSNLQVHHIQNRSHQGDDSGENLLTLLCAVSSKRPHPREKPVADMPPR